MNVPITITQRTCDQPECPQKGERLARCNNPDHSQENAYQFGDDPFFHTQGTGDHGHGKKRRGHPSSFCCEPCARWTEGNFEVREIGDSLVYVRVERVTLVARPSWDPFVADTRHVTHDGMEAGRIVKRALDLADKVEPGWDKGDKQRRVMVRRVLVQPVRVPVMGSLDAPVGEDGDGDMYDVLEARGASRNPTARQAEARLARDKDLAEHVRANQGKKNDWRNQDVYRSKYAKKMKRRFTVRRRKIT